MNKNKNRLEIRLDPDSQTLLDSLVARTSLTKTSLIKKALIVYASTLKNGHIYTVKLKGEAIKEEKPLNNEEKIEESKRSYEEIIEELEKDLPKEEENPDKLPF